MRRCNKCVMSDQRPGIQFDEAGTCYPCILFEKRKKINWGRRHEELERLCNAFRRSDGNDCLICISGGKDSHFLAWLFKTQMDMNPIGFMVDNSSWTKTGRENFYNLSEAFDMDILTFTPKLRTFKERVRSDFYEFLHPFKYWDEILYEKPLEMAKKLGIKLIIWGENVSIERGGKNWKESIDASILTPKGRQYNDLTVIFTSHYVNWSSFKNLKIAKMHGFKTLIDTREWNRKGFYPIFQGFQIDTKGYLINQYCKFIKFGFSTMTELCSEAIRLGIMSRDKAINIVKHHDWELDPIMLEDFCNVFNISKESFWKTIDKFANRELLYMDDDGYWKSKEWI
ncbi:MAG: N-acetyl sugar amidotransferase [Promethearchaeota archaeon]